METDNLKEKESKPSVVVKNGGDLTINCGVYDVIIYQRIKTNLSVS